MEMPWTNACAAASLLPKLWNDSNFVFVYDFPLTCQQMHLNIEESKITLKEKYF